MSEQGEGRRRLCHASQLGMPGGLSIPWSESSLTFNETLPGSIPTRLTPENEYLVYGACLRGAVRRQPGCDLSVDAGGTLNGVLDAGHWQERLGELAERHRVPGAVLGVLRLRPEGEDELVETAWGVLNLETGVETTTDSVFQIGSITKTWIATMAMQLVDEGVLRLDDPVRRVLPELRLADREAAAQVTMRHLLAHTSGIDGDIGHEASGEEAVAKYVAALAGVGQTHPPGATWSYCNSGYVIAGRVVEALTGGTWDQAVRERLTIRWGSGGLGRCQGRPSCIEWRSATCCGETASWCDRRSGERRARAVRPG